MKNALIFTCLLIILSSCGNNTKEGNESHSRIDSSETGKAKVLTHSDTNGIRTPENHPPKIEPPRNCGNSELRTYLNDPDESGTNIRNSPGGKVITTLVKDDLNFEYFIFLTEANNGWFKIKSPISGMETDIDLPNGEGWIHGSVVSVDTRNYGGQHLKLLDEPEIGNVVGIIEGESFGLRLKDFCGDWVKVEYNGIVGWIEKDWLCGNPLTTCA